MAEALQLSTESTAGYLDFSTTPVGTRGCLRMECPPIQSISGLWRVIQGMTTPPLRCSGTNSLSRCHLIVLELGTARR